MTNLTETSVFEPGVFQLETDTPTLGGPPGFNLGVPVTGHANAQALQLANRTKWLYDSLSDISNQLGEGKYKIVACVLRNTGSGWYAITDTNHRPINVQSVTVDGLSVKVTYPFTAKKVISLVATPDETLASLGISTGASVTPSYCNIEMTGEFKGFVDTTNGLSTVNAYSHWGATVANTPSGTVVSHNNISNSTSYPLIQPFRNSSSAPIPNYNIVVQVAGTTSFTVMDYVPVSGYFSYNGSSWVFSSAALNSAFSASFSGGVLTVTGPFTGNIYNINAISRSEVYRVVSDGVTDNSFKLKFVNNAGVVATTPDTNMKFFFSTAGLMPASEITTTNGVRFHFNRGQCRIDPNNFSSASGNIWVYGLFEVD